MLIGKYNHCLVTVLAFCTMVLLAASCTTAPQQVQYEADDPRLPADSAPYEGRADTDRSQQAPASPGKSDPLKVTITEAILLCLENNRSLMVQRLEPLIQQTFEEQERAVFDPAARADLSAGKKEGERLARSGSATETYTTDTAEGVISLEQYFPTGTALTLEADTQMDDSSLYSDRFYSTRIGMTISQALLRGYGMDVNLARLQQARLDTRMSEYELRGFTELLVAEVEQAYWDYALALRQIEIVEESLKVARQQMEETQALIAVGRLAKVELAAVQAEVAAQEQALIEARAAKESIRLKLLRLLTPGGGGSWQREIELIHQPTLPEIQLEEVTVHVAVAERMRPVLNQARLEIMRDNLELVQTRNGLLPLMDIFITLGKSGYANSFGDSIDNIDRDSYDALAGIRFYYPLFNREAEAQHRRAQLTRDQDGMALANLSQLVELDVRTAYIEVDRTKQQVAASAVTRKFDEETLRTESEKLRVGKSTSFMVAQAQRDLLISRIAEVQSIANYLKALVNLYRQDGSLLVRRGIQAPGRDPVKPPPGNGFKPPSRD